jgi:predicted nuclease of predicted toxin-antitoxin system
MPLGGLKSAKSPYLAHERQNLGGYESVPSVGACVAGGGWAVVHWSTVGDPRATDRTILDWAVANGYVVFTHDLDFGTALALTHGHGPSVIQVRGQDVLPEHMGSMMIAVLKQHDTELASGALVVVDESKSRIRILPM